eukprot:2216108-Alexandrium_andersonii.AAC.1
MPLRMRMLSAMGQGVNRPCPLRKQACNQKRPSAPTAPRPEERPSSIARSENQWSIPPHAVE